MSAEENPTWRDECAITNVRIMHQLEVMQDVLYHCIARQPCEVREPVVGVCHVQGRLEDLQSTASHTHSKHGEHVGINFQGKPICHGVSPPDLEGVCAGR